MLEEKFLEEQKERFASNRGLNGFKTKRKLAGNIANNRTVMKHL